MRNYLSLVSKVLKRGQDHNGTQSLFGETLDFDLEKGFPLVTTRKINFKAAFAELYCFLQGWTDVRRFREVGVNFWDADCAKESWQKNPACSSPFDLGKTYGYQWCYGFGFNQIHNLIKNIKQKPSSRRHILITFNPADITKTALPWCYVSAQFYVEKNKLNMLVHQRSADIILGLPSDIASFSLLLSLLAKEVGLKPAILKIIIGDAHIYTSHILNSYDLLEREPLPLPYLELSCSLLDFDLKKVGIHNYLYHPSIRFPFEVQEAEQC